MTSTDQKKLFNKMKHNLEDRREFVLLIDSILKWEKKFYPAIIFAVITLFYLFLWYLDFSVLTLASLTLLAFLIEDYCSPILCRMIFKPENWTGAQENRLEKICEEICEIRSKFISYVKAMINKEKRSTVLLVSVSLGLCALAWIGTVVDNLLLNYLVTLILAFYPGLHEHGIIGTIKGKFGTVITAKLNALKEKANKTD